MFSFTLSLLAKRLLGYIGHFLLMSADITEYLKILIQRLVEISGNVLIVSVKQELSRQIICQPSAIKILDHAIVFGIAYETVLCRNAFEEYDRVFEVNVVVQTQ